MIIIEASKTPNPQQIVKRKSLCYKKYENGYLEDLSLKGTEASQVLAAGFQSSSIPSLTSEAPKTPNPQQIA